MEMKHFENKYDTVVFFVIKGSCAYKHTKEHISRTVIHLKGEVFSEKLWVISLVRKSIQLSKKYWGMHILGGNRDIAEELYGSFVAFITLLYCRILGNF